jgi:tRNA(fMet)-specific endonuclease VapC
VDVVLLDTDVFSYRLKNDSRARLFDHHLDGKQLALSFMTVAEVFRWAIHRAWGAQRIADLQAELRQFLVLPYDEAMAWEWARVSCIKGRPMAPGDAWIAATALRHKLPFATHNSKHFANVPGLVLLSPVQAP